ncbi:KCNH5, partial [Symbiodinium sp. CCMP2456]
MASERVRPSQRFQRLLDQLSQCHEEELNRTVPTWLSADVDRVRHELTCPKCSFNLNVALPNSVNEDAKWGTRVRAPVHSDTICSGSGIRVEEITSPPPVPRPVNLLTVADATPLKLRGDLDATPRSSESDVSVLEDDQEESAAQRITNAVSGISNITSHRSRSQGADERFPLRRLWATESKVTTMRVTRRAASKSKSIELEDTLSGSAQAEGGADGYTAAMADWRRRLISYPSSLHRLVWDMMGGLLIMYDLFAVPLQAF